MNEVSNTGVPESQLDYVLRQGNVLFYRRRIELALLSGVPRSTINKVMDGTRKNSRSSTIEALYRVMQAEEIRVNKEKKEAHKTQRKAKT
jgi:hypothetical protein